jgi:hypothetical protein
MLNSVADLRLFQEHAKNRFWHSTVYDRMSVEVIYAPGYIDRSLMVLNTDTFTYFGFQ